MKKIITIISVMLMLTTQTTARADEVKTPTPVVVETVSTSVATTETTSTVAETNTTAEQSASTGHQRSFGEKALLVAATPFVIVGGIIYYAVATVVLVPVYIVKKATGQI